MRKDLLPAILAGSILVVTVGVSMAPSTRSSPWIISVSFLLLLILLVLLVLNLSVSARRLVASVLSYVVTYYGLHRVVPLSEDLATLRRNADEVRQSFYELDEPNWQPLSKLQCSVRRLADRVKDLDGSAGDPSFRSERDSLEADLNVWAESIGTLKIVSARDGNVAGGTPGRDWRSELERSKPDELDVRLTRLLSRLLYQSHAGRFERHVQNGFAVVSGLTLLVAVLVIFRIHPSLPAGYRTVIGLLAGGIMTYYMGEGFVNSSDG